MNARWSVAACGGVIIIHELLTTPRPEMLALGAGLIGFPFVTCQAQVRRSARAVTRWTTLDGRFHARLDTGDTYHARSVDRRERWIDRHRPETATPERLGGYTLPLDQTEHP